jgi:hypothetical protein
MDLIDRLQTRQTCAETISWLRREYATKIGIVIHRPTLRNERIVPLENVVSY